MLAAADGFVDMVLIHPLWLGEIQLGFRISARLASPLLPLCTSVYMQMCRCRKLEMRKRIVLGVKQMKKRIFCNSEIWDLNREREIAVGGNVLKSKMKRN